MALPRPPQKMIETNGLNLAVCHAGGGPSVLLLHGFPATSLSLHHQFSCLVDAGYDCIAIDQRGFGASDCPKPVEAYRMDELVKDIVGILDALEIAEAILLGHDWGGAVAWQVALAHPERVQSVISLGTILFPRPDIEPIGARRALMGDKNYVVAFQEPGVADALLDFDVERSINYMFRKNYMTLDKFASASPVIQRFELLEELSSEPYEGEAVLDPEEKEALIQAFERTGFTPGINWYRNITRNWRDSTGRPEKIEKPCLLVSGEDDYFSPASLAAASDTLIPNLEKVLVSGGHWFPMETPEETNAAILGWLQKQR